MINKKIKFLFNFIWVEKFSNKIFLNGKKEKYLKYIFDVFKNLKKSKIKPLFLFFLILEKLRPLFFFSKNKIKKKKRKQIIYKPYLLTIKQRYLIAIKWFLLPLKKKKKFILKLEDCFLDFLNKSILNLGLLQKKKTYLIILKQKHFLKL